MSEWPLPIRIAAFAMIVVVASVVGVLLFPFVVGTVMMGPVVENS